MNEAQKLAVRPRTVLGKKVRALRRGGVLPAVVYGGHADSTPIETDAHTFALGYRRWGRTTLLTLEGLPGGDVPALISEVARDPRTGRFFHIDFARVSLTEKTHADVPLHFVGEAGAVKNVNAVLVQAMDHVRVEAFPQDIPRRIDVDLRPLEEVDDAVHVRDLVVDTTKVRILNDEDELVVKAVPTRVEEEPVAPAAAPLAEGEVEAAAEEAEGEAKAAPAAGGSARAATPAKGAPEKSATGAPEKPEKS
ncbi:MAG TPA: 50S ribosomal protein L25 [Candidatus Limnocylindrales bacterium]|nr:50S ribosomal protein L25 [Candidatus Limnocylindrales bacterium]